MIRSDLNSSKWDEISAVTKVKQRPGAGFWRFMIESFKQSTKTMIFV